MDLLLVIQTGFEVHYYIRDERATRNFRAARSMGRPDRTWTGQIWNSSGLFRADFLNKFRAGLGLGRILIPKIRAARKKLRLAITKYRCTGMPVPSLTKFTICKFPLHVKRFNNLFYQCETVIRPLTQNIDSLKRN